MSIQISLAVQHEIQAQLDEAHRLRYKQVERARYESDCARRRYMNVDPENRLVADSLEAQWNKKLRALAKAQDDYERKRRDDRKLLDQTRLKKLFSLPKNFPAIWDDLKTPHREPKRMIALLIEDVTLLKKEQIIIQVRFRAGATTTVKIPLPLNAWQGRKTAEHVLSKMDELLNKYTDSQVAQRLNRLGLTTGAGENFTTHSVKWARYANGLKSYSQRLKALGMLTTKQVAIKFEVSETTVRNWRKKGLIKGCIYDDKGQWLYSSPLIM